MDFVERMAVVGAVLRRFVPGLAWLGLGVVAVLAGCMPTAETTESLSPADSLAAAPRRATLTPTAARPSATATLRPTHTALATTTHTATATHTPTASPSPTVPPTNTATSTPTPRPTPTNLPPAPSGWRWEFYAAGIPVTHYIIYELPQSGADEARERPYGLDNKPLPGINALPRSFLQQTAYQGSGRLPSGDVLQYAATRPPVQKGHVPFRYVVVPQTRCEGHPIAGNRTCSVPFETAATTWREDDGPLIPVGSTVFIPEINLKLRINDVALTDGPHKVDLYTGTVNNYDYERPDGAQIWRLVEE